MENNKNKNENKCKKAADCACYILGLSFVPLSIYSFFHFNGKEFPDINPFLDLIAFIIASILGAAVAYFCLSKNNGRDTKQIIWGLVLALGAIVIFCTSLFSCGGTYNFYLCYYLMYAVFSSILVMCFEKLSNKLIRKSVTTKQVD